MRPGQLILLLATLLFYSANIAQKSTARIFGSVSGGSKKLPLAEAVITLSSPALSGSRIVLTDSTGNYLISNLIPGTYNITFEMEGYKTTARTNVVLTEGEAVALNIEMARGRDKGRAAEETIIMVSDRRRSR